MPRSAVGRIGHSGSLRVYSERVRINPRSEPSAEAIDVALQIRANGGSLAAEEWEFSQHYAYRGSASSRTKAIEMAGPGGAIVGRPGAWTVYHKRHSDGSAT